LLGVEIGKRRKRRINKLLNGCPDRLQTGAFRNDINIASSAAVPWL
jgi:hypothetical protein